MEKHLDIQRILDYLPHRFPFIMVDRVIDIKPGRAITGVKNVSMNEPYFQGHFPGRPIMPGVLILEAMAQTGAILLYASGFQKKQDLIYLGGIDKIRFRKPVVPGDQLILNLTIMNQRSRAIKMKAIASVDDRRAAEAEFIATLVKE